MFPVMFFQLIIAVVVISLILYLVGLIPGIDQTLLKVVRIVVIAVFIIWILYMLMGMVSGGPIFTPYNHR